MAALGDSECVLSEEEKKELTKHSQYLLHHSCYVFMS